MEIEILDLNKKTLLLLLDMFVIISIYVRLCFHEYNYRIHVMMFILMHKHNDNIYICLDEDESGCVQA